MKRHTRATSIGIIVCLASRWVLAQTPIKLPRNKYTPEQDVKLGLEAAAEVSKHSA